MPSPHPPAAEAVSVMHVNSALRTLIGKISEYQFFSKRQDNLWSFRCWRMWALSISVSRLTYTCVLSGVAWPNVWAISVNSRVSEMQRFSQYLCKQGYPSYLLPALPKCGEQHVPYIFSVDELHRIFERLDTLTPTNLSPNRHFVMPLLFRILLPHSDVF